MTLTDAVLSGVQREILKDVYRMAEFKQRENGCRVVKVSLKQAKKLGGRRWKGGSIYIDDIEIRVQD